MICLYYFNVKFIKRAEGFKSSIFSLSFPSVLLLGTQETIYRFISFLFGLYHGLSRNYHPCYRSYYLVLSCDWAEVGNGSSRSKYFPLSAPGCRMGNCLHWVERKDFWRLSFFFYFFPTAVAAAGRSPPATLWDRSSILQMDVAHIKWTSHFIITEKHLWCFCIAPGALPSHRLHLLLSLPHPCQTEHPSAIHNPIGVAFGLGMSWTSHGHRCLECIWAQEWCSASIHGSRILPWTGSRINPCVVCSSLSLGASNPSLMRVLPFCLVRTCSSWKLEEAARCSWSGNEAAAGLQPSISQNHGWKYLLWTNSIFQAVFKLLGDETGWRNILSGIWRWQKTKHPEDIWEGIALGNLYIAYVKWP